MSTIKKITATLALCAGLTVSSAWASGDLSLRHELATFDSGGDPQRLTFYLDISNEGTSSLRHIVLSVADGHMGDTDSSRRIRIRRLAPGASTAVFWQADSLLDAAYFRAGAPLSFRVNAINEDGDRVAFPVHSQAMGGY